MRRRIVAVVILCLAAALSARAQWFDHRAPGVPRMKDGTPKLSARAPRTADGKPNLSGIWRTDATPADELNRLFPGLANLAVPGDGPEVLHKCFLNVFAGLRPQEEPLRPETVPVLMQRAAGPGKDSPTARCLPGSMPLGDLPSIPRQFVQAPSLLVILYEGINPQRLIHLDGRRHPVDPQPAWLGYSVGAWEGDTLVVETRGFNDRAWLDAFGHPRSEAMRAHLVGG